MDRPLVFVTVGTDHHRFDRLIDWTDRWIERVGDRARVLVQHGHSRPPMSAGAEAATILPFDRLQEVLRHADALVTPGPTTVMEALEHGLRAICVPRDPARGEHVDDHQVTFARFFADQGKLLLADSEEALHARLDVVLEDRAAYRFDPGEAPAPPGIARIGALVDGLVWGTG